MNGENRKVPAWGLLAASTSLGYLLIALAWVGLSDHLVSSLVRDPAMIAWMQTRKEWFFVGVTALLLALLLSWYGRAQQTLMKRATERERALVGVTRTTQNAVALLDENGALTMANPAFADLFGHTPTSIVGRALPQLAAPHAYGTPDLGALLDKTRRNGIGVERVVLLGRDGSARPVRFLASILEGEESNHGGFVLSGIDLRDREETEARVQRLQQVIAEHVVDRLDLESVVNNALRAAVAVTHADIAGVALLEPSGKMAYRWLVGFPEGADIADLLKPFSREEGLAGAVYQEQRPLVIENYRAASNVLPSFRDSGLRSGMGVPLKVGDEVPGALVVGSMRRTHAFSEENGPVLEAIARQIAAALRHVRVLEDLRQTQARLERIAEAVPDVLFSAQLPGFELTFISPGVESIFGITVSDLMANPDLLRAHTHPEDRERVQAAFAAAVEVGATVDIEYRVDPIINKDLRVECRARVERSGPGGPLALFGVIRDITARRAAEDRLEFLAFHDSLTELPNLHGFRAKLNELPDTAHGVVMYLDLDRFGVYSEVFGDDVAEQVLQSIAARIAAVIGSDGLVARVIRDEFLIWLPTPAGEEHVRGNALADRIRLALVGPVELGDEEVFASASIGYSLRPADSGDASVLVAHAQKALRKAKEGGGGGVAAYQVELSEKGQRMFSMEARLRKAIERHEFRLVYQPLVDLSSGQMVGVEALLRWVDSAGNATSPVDFIPVAEETGLIVPIGDWVMDKVCLQVAEWNAGGIHIFGAFNVSVRQFWGGDLVARVMESVRRSGVDPTRIEVEITETAAMLDPERAQRVMVSLAEAGVKMAIDDFGTGYSSMARLRALPVHKLKVDRSFVSGIGGDVREAAIVDSIVQIARSLHMTSLAEGIETVSQRDSLRQLGCQQGQGYLFSPPVPAEQIAKFYGKSFLT